MDDNTYKKRLEEARHLEAFIETCMLSDKLYVEFDSENNEKFDFYFKPDYNKPVYSTAFVDKGDAFILGVFRGLELSNKWVV